MIASWQRVIQRRNTQADKPRDDFARSRLAAHTLTYTVLSSTARALGGMFTSLQGGLRLKRRLQTKAYTSPQLNGMQLVTPQWRHRATGELRRRRSAIQAYIIFSFWLMLYTYTRFRRTSGLRQLLQPGRGPKNVFQGICDMSHVLYAYAVYTDVLSTYIGTRLPIAIVRWAPSNEGIYIGIVSGRVCHDRTVFIHVL